MFGICFFTGCRISEALQLRHSDLVGDRIVFRASTTKGKKTREVAINPQLRSLLEAYGLPEAGYLFPGRNGSYLTSQAADLALRQATDYIGLQGTSTHSFRRSALTHLAANGVPLRVVQTISGHASLATLQRYLEVMEDQRREAVLLLIPIIYDVALNTAEVMYSQLQRDCTTSAVGFSKTSKV